MKLVTKMGFISMIAVSVLLSGSPEKLVSEESLGLRKVDLYSEDQATPDQTNYTQQVAGTSKTINRAFQDAPPMIPHSVEGMLPIVMGNNQCTNCHMPEVAPSVKATPIPESHFTNFRAESKAIKGENTSDAKMADVSIKKSTKLVGARFNCSQCHAPQSDGELVENTFTPDFTSKDGATKSSWEGSKLTEGLDTLME
jgi:cytochrome c-type protein NapB